MLNVFHTSKDSDKLKFNRFAQVKDESGNKVSFKYNKLERSDTTRKDFLKGIEMQENIMIIRTLSGFPFNIGSKILINSKQYKVSNIYKEEQECGNGQFHKSKPFVYLVLAS